ncbi:MAG TPA: amidohydrolase [Longimicrobiales bacterium]|nr:amidohydrolase [Longimicrobiales bacterium]
MPNPVDLVLVNGLVWTGEAGAPLEEAVAIRDGRVRAVGSTSSIERYRDDETRVIDLGGRLLIPAFSDAHTHFISGGFQLAGVDLRVAETPEEFTRLLGAYASMQPVGTWIDGGDWDHERWPGAPLPDRTWIDSVTADHFVFVSRLDGHMGLANSRALERAGIDESTPDPPGGTIVRDPSGRPTGVLKDAAMDMIWEVLPEPSAGEIDEALMRAQAHALSLGVAAVHDMGSWEGLDTYVRAQRDGRLRMRVYAVVPIATWRRLVSYVTRHGRGDDMLQWGGLKGFVDGSLGSTTAWFHEPYVDEPGTTGLMVTDTSALREMIMAADAARLHVMVHAVGDRANDWLLDVYRDTESRNGERDRRFRVEHAQHLTDEAIGRFGEMGVIPSMQPYHAADDGRWAEKRIGPDRIRNTYAFRDLIDSGARPAFGSDWTVAPLDPLEGIRAAVTRRTIDGANPDGWVPEQKISVEEALVGYTRNAAFAGYMEDDIGRIAEGMAADLVVLSDNILGDDPGALERARVDLTLVNGAVVYRRR